MNLSPGINVFIGANGTGKTHLLKVAYSACDFNVIESEIIMPERHFREKLTRVFLPYRNDIGRLVKHSGAYHEGVVEVWYGDQQFRVAVSKRGTGGGSLHNLGWPYGTIKSLFIPAKEVLAILQPGGAGARAGESRRPPTQPWEGSVAVREQTVRAHNRWVGAVREPIQVEAGEHDVAAVVDPARGALLVEAQMVRSDAPAGVGVGAIVQHLGLAAGRQPYGAVMVPVSRSCTGAGLPLAQLIQRDDNLNLHVRERAPAVAAPPQQQVDLVRVVPCVARRVVEGQDRATW